MNEKWESFKATLTDTTSMSKREFLLTIAVCILGGIVFGMLFSPRKVMTIGSNNGNNSGNCADKDTDEDTSADVDEVDKED